MVGKTFLNVILMDLVSLILPFPMPRVVNMIIATIILVFVRLINDKKKVSIFAIILESIVSNDVCVTQITN